MLYLYARRASQIKLFLAQAKFSSNTILKKSLFSYLNTYDCGSANL